MSLELGKTDQAHAILLETPEEDKDSTDTQTKWKRLSDAALKDTNLDLCEAASVASNDFSDLLLLYSATGNMSGMGKLAKLAADNGRTNVAFVAYLLTGNVEACADLLIATHRLPEAAFFVRTYLPSRMDEVVALWKTDLASVSETAAKSLATPAENGDLFPDMSIALQVEQMFLSQREGTRATGIPASDYMTAKDDLDLNLIQLIKQRDQPQPTPEELAAAEAAKAEAEAAAAAAAAEEAARLEAEAAAAAAAQAEAEAAAAAEAQAAATKMEDSGNDFGDDW